MLTARYPLSQPSAPQAFKNDVHRSMLPPGDSGVDGTCVSKDVTTGIHCGHQRNLSYAGGLRWSPRLEAALPPLASESCDMSLHRGVNTCVDRLAEKQGMCIHGMRHPQAVPRLPSESEEGTKLLAPSKNNQIAPVARQFGGVPRRKSTRM